MIPRTIPTAYTPNWQEELKNLITCPKSLYQALELDLDSLPAAWRGHERFQVRVTPSYLARIEKGNADDPLLKQVLPAPQELDESPEFIADPLNENHHNPVKGVIHKYHGRVLFITSGQCAINCRYCFRREFDYLANSPSRKEWSEALAYIQQDDSINEVILSGGDPLVINDRQLEWLINAIESIPHITRIRIHTRLPIVMPSRINPELTNILSANRLNCVVVIHANHAQEFNTETQRALEQLKNHGITLLNQSVLLAGINDSVEPLRNLSETLFAQGVLPYYLHLLDKVRGAMHFDVSESRATELHRELQRVLPGFLVPKLVREIPGKASKTAIF